MSGAAILLYHRVAEPPTDPWWLSVSRANFAAHVDILGRDYDVVPLGSLLDGRQERRRRVAITFDDGYVDNLTEAASTLAERGLPVTFFLISTPLQDGAELWWDWLDRLVLRTASLPDELIIETEAGPQRWSVPDLPEEDPERLSWRAWEAPEHGRHRLYLELYDILFAAAPSERTRLLAELAEWAMPGESGDCPRVMTTAEAFRLAAVPGVEIGAHTESHPCLARLSASAQEQEIVGCRHTLEHELGRPVSSFSYPFGRPSDYTVESAELVRRASFDLACSSVPALVTANADRFQLPRLTVHNRSGPDFAQWLGRVWPDDL